MLMAVTVIFVGCWLPLNVIHITLDYYEKVATINRCTLLSFSLASVVKYSY